MATSRLTRSLYRSVLRFARCPAVKSYGFRIDPVISFDVAPLQLSGKLVIESGRDLADLAKNIFKTTPTASANLDKALDSLKKLNIIHADIREKYKLRGNNSSLQVLQHRVFRIGQVIQHKETGTRAVVVGWTVEDAVQHLYVLVDHLDSVDLLRPGSPLLKGQTKTPASSFTAVTDEALLRVYQESIPQYFTEFDLKRGGFTPNSNLRFSYPLDDVVDTDCMSNEIASSSLSSLPSPAASSAELDAAAARVVAAVIRVGEEIERLALSRGIQPIPADGTRDTNLIKNGSRTSSTKNSSDATSPYTPILSTASEISSLVLDDVLLSATLCKALPPPSDGKHSDSRSASKNDPKSYRSNQTETLRMASAALSHLSNCFSTADQLLQLRFQSQGIGYFEELVRKASESISPGKVDDSNFKFFDDSILPATTFSVGQIVRHKKFGYRGVITGFDMRPLLDVSTWDGVIGLPSGSEQPFYRIVPDEDDVVKFLGADKFRSSYYVAQENLEEVVVAGASSKHTNSVGGNSDVLIRHRHIPLYFAGFDINSSSFTVPHKLKFCFPRSSNGANKASLPEDRVEALAFADAEKLLIDVYALMKSVFINSRTEQGEPLSSDSEGKTSSSPSLFMSDLFTLLRCSSRREDALVVEALLWMIWMAHSDPNVCRALRQGVSNMKRGRTSHAFDSFSIASALDPHFAEPHNKLAALHHKVSEHAQCAFRAQACLKLFPQHYGALAGMGMSLEKSGNIPGAQKAIREALRLHPFASHLPTVLNTLLLDTADQQILRKGARRTQAERQAREGKGEDRTDQK